MHTISLLNDLEFHDDHPYAQPLYVDNHGRALRFMLKPGQEITEHQAPSSPFYVIILQGTGVFTDSSGQQYRAEPNGFFVFEPGEKHSVRAGDDALIFLGLLHGAPGAKDKTPSGKMVE